MPLSEYFDVVLMLTWSDWKTEPRSNRYHFATRFAQQLPVLFVQPRIESGPRLNTESTEVVNLELVHVSRSLIARKLDADTVDELLALLRQRGFKRPLAWVYNTLDYQMLIESLPNAFYVYHATEDYLTDVGIGASSSHEIGDSIKRTLPFIDILIGVSPNVVKSYQMKAGYTGPIAVVENGCDSKFFLDLLKLNPPVAGGKRTAIFQGGINRRLDFPLLLELVSMLPDWNFQFCGAADGGLPGWRALAKKPNVSYLGHLAPDAFGKLLCEATVGIIPFNQDEYIFNSLPLKAYEYVACGLPVVTVPIAALERDADLFARATTAKDFAVAMEAAARERFNPSQLARRREAAMANCYDARFSMMSATLVNERKAVLAKSKCLNAVMLYDDRSMHISTIHEHISAFKKYSSNNFQFMPAVAHGWSCSDEELSQQINLSIFDVLVVHYSVRVSTPNHLSEPVAKEIERFRGLKILFIQDEYDTPETTRKWMDRLHFDIVYSCIPPKSLELVYPTARYPTTEFLPTLTGYVPENPEIDQFAIPIADRQLLIAYRGRKLPFIYGTLGYEKYRIGLDVKRLANQRGLPVDIEVDDSRRIYGIDWYRFLGSARATLGTESGSNLFDFDGTIKEAIESLLRENPNLTFDQVREAAFNGAEETILMNQISPKIFEAIRLRTALVLFEGSYSSVVAPDLHFIPLKKDYSNIDDVFEKLKDTKYLEEMTARAYADVIGSGRYSYRRFVETIDRDIASRVLHRAAYEHFTSTTLVRGRDGSVRSVLPSEADGFMLSNQILGADFKREQLIESISFPRMPRELAVVPGAVPVPSRSVLRLIVALGTSKSTVSRFLRATFRRMPLAVRSRIIRLVEFLASNAR